VTVPPASKVLVRTAEADTEPPATIVEAERLAVIVGLALPIEIEIASWCDSNPLVSVIVTTYVPLAEGAQDSNEVPDPVKFVGESVQTSPVDGDGAAVRETAPTNPLSSSTVKVEFPGIPTVTLTVAGLAVIEMS
jgi:hypothetical protein